MIRILAALVFLGAPSGAISKSDFEKLHSELVPTDLSKWQTIPWKVDLLESRELASRSGKPLFLWSMNGHPLGCT